MKKKKGEIFPYRIASRSEKSIGYHSAVNPLAARVKVPRVGNLSNPSRNRFTVLSNKGACSL